jgi:hypothetical protein
VEYGDWREIPNPWRGITRRDGAYRPAIACARKLSEL